VSIIDQIGTYKTDKLKNGNKFCPYWFGTRKELLLKYLNVDWGNKMPEYETLGKLTEKMLEDGARIYEWEEDKSNILFDGTKSPEKGKNLGYYHVRSGSTPAVLLAWKNSPEHQVQYQEYIKNQPKSEYLRQIFLYQYMCVETGNYLMYDEATRMIIIDIGLTVEEKVNYTNKFREYHGL
ncbi:MAG: hypothetical protein AABY22_32140, partial [Nanoarchaeota archaeon]